MLISFPFHLFFFFSCPSISHFFPHTLSSRCFHHPLSPVRHHLHSLHKRDFFRQNLIKSHLLASLKLETLDALMRISCANIPVENINWNAMMLVSRNMKDRRIHSLL